MERTVNAGAAANRGRQIALGEIASSPTSEVAGVHIVCSAGEVVVARVRDDSGIWDVSHGAETGWTCSCGELCCAHALATQQTLRVVI